MIPAPPPPLGGGRPPPSPGPTLQERLDHLRAALGSPLAAPRAAAAPKDVLRPPAPGAPSADIIGWLAHEVCRRVGIAVNDSVKTKLDKIARTVPPQDLSRWAERLASVEADHPEWLSLVEMLTVHETYFLRDPGQFDFVRRLALPEIIADQKNKPSPTVRLWSAACSTGEEAYSLAFLILEALADSGQADIDAQGNVRFNRRWTIEVLGSDLSRQAVRTAQNGVYQDFGLGAFRSLPKGYWRFFDRVEGASGPGGSTYWRIKDSIRQFVRFQQFNLMSPAAPTSQLDIVFCRNVLIYFDASGKRHVFRMIHRALKESRFAVFGPTDIPDNPELFKANWGTSTVIYRRI